MFLKQHIKALQNSLFIINCLHGFFEAFRGFLNKNPKLLIMLFRRDKWKT